MRNIVLFLFLGLMVMSCSSDDDSNNIVTTDQIIGTWRIVSESYNGQQLEINDCHMQHGKLIFYNEQKAFIESGERIGNSCYLDSGEYSYILFENDLRMFSYETGYDEFRYKVKKLTQNELVIEHYYTEESPMPVIYYEEGDRVTSTYSRVAN